MQKRSNFFYIFLSFLLLIASVFILSSFGLLKVPASILSAVFSPIQGAAYSVSNIKGESKEVALLKEENENLREEISKSRYKEEDIKALRDQFENAFPRSQILIPADVIGSPNFVPGVTTPTELIINRGEQDGVKKGNAVVFKNNLIGVVVDTLIGTSKVSLITSPNLSFTAQTEMGTTGVVKGDGSKDIILENVVLSDKLEKGDTVLTRGNASDDGVGIYPNLTIGKIVSVDKKASDLFQRAKIQTLVDLARISKVFIVNN